MTEDGMNELRQEQKMSVESQTHMFFQLVRPSMKKILTLGFLHAPQSSIWARGVNRFIITDYSHHIHPTVIKHHQPSPHFHMVTINNPLVLAVRVISYN